MTPRDAISALPHKTFDVEFKDLADNGSFSAYVACFGNVDRQGDIIDQGAFDNLAEFQRDGWIAVSHDQHNPPIAYIDRATQDSMGLLVEGTFHSTECAQQVRTVVKERMSAGKGVKCSIGYVTRDESFERKNGEPIRRIKQLSVYEASIVWLPANPRAEVQAVKSALPGDLEGSDNPEDEDDESEADMSERTVVEAIKHALGLETKAGRKISAENVTKLKSIADAMDSHGSACIDQAKALKAHGQKHKSEAAGFHEYLKSFTSGQQQDVDDDSDGSVADKANDETETKAFRDRLKARAIEGRRSSVCP